jgi:hypothetical protein
LLVVSPAYAGGYTVIKADLHLYSKYSQEPWMTENREVLTIAQDVMRVLGIPCALAVTDRSDVVMTYPRARSVLTENEWEWLKLTLPKQAGKPAFPFC